MQGIDHGCEHHSNQPLNSQPPPVSGGFVTGFGASWQVELPALGWPRPLGFAWKGLKQPELDGQQKTLLKIEVPGWQEGDDKLVQAKLNWDLAEWESNQNSKVFCLNQQTKAELPTL